MYICEHATGQAVRVTSCEAEVEASPRRVAGDGHTHAPWCLALGTRYTPRRRCLQRPGQGAQQCPCWGGGNPAGMTIILSAHDRIQDTASRKLQAHRWRTDQVHAALVLTGQQAYLNHAWCDSRAPSGVHLHGVKGHNGHCQRQHQGTLQQIERSVSTAT